MILKRFKLDTMKSEDKEAVKKECGVSQALAHPFVVKVNETTETDEHVIIVYEKCSTDLK